MKLRITITARSGRQYDAEQIIPISDRSPEKVLDDFFNGATEAIQRPGLFTLDELPEVTAADIVELRIPPRRITVGITNKEIEAIRVEVIG